MLRGFSGKMQSNGIVPNAFPSSVPLLVLDMVLGILQRAVWFWEMEWG